MRVLIVEPDLTGHHAPYLRLFLEAISELQQTAVVLTSREARRMPQYAIHLENIADRYVWDDRLDPPAPSLSRTRRLYRELIPAIVRHQADQVWVPYADFLTKYVGARAAIGFPPRWPQGVETEGLLFRGTFAYPLLDWRKLARRQIAELLTHRANWHRLHFLDSIPYEHICRTHPEHAHRFGLMPDPVEDIAEVPREVAREKLAIPVDGTYFAYLGLMYDKASAVRLLAAFQRAVLPPTCRMLLAGPMVDAVEHCVDQEFGELLRKGRVIKMNRHLSVSDVMLGVMASDVVCVPAKHRIGSSSFVIRAAAAGRPVLADNFGWTGLVVRRFNLGWPVDVDDATALAHAFESAIEQAAGWVRCVGADRFVRFHSAANFKAHWTVRLRERLGLPPEPNFVPWQWVVEVPPANGEPTGRSEN